MTRDQMIKRRQQLHAELEQLNKDLLTCHSCEHCRSDNFCIEYQVKLDEDAILRGPKECPQFLEDPIPF
jgi:hypothetical protein